MALLAANLEAKQGRTDNARKMYAVAAAHALSTIAFNKLTMFIHAHPNLLPAQLAVLKMDTSSCISCIRFSP